MDANEKPVEFLTVDTPDGPGGVPAGLVAMAVPALDDQNAPILGTYVVYLKYPARIVVKAALEDLARMFGLAIFNGADRNDLFAVDPRMVVLAMPEKGLLNTTALVLVQLPQVVPTIRVNGSLTDVLARLKAAQAGEVMAPPSKLLLS
jgi:hypothetical protein